MENSYEAIYTGVYLFVFVAALTIALYLFQGVNDLADRSYDYGKVVEGNAVIETDTEEKKYLSREDLISYYFNYIKKDNYENGEVPSGLPGLTIIYGGNTLNSTSGNDKVYSFFKSLPEGNYLLTFVGSNNWKINKV